MKRLHGVVKPNPCEHCLNGNGHLCIAVRCYRCDCGCRTRSHGVRSTADPAPGKPPGKQLPRFNTMRVEP